MNDKITKYALMTVILIVACGLISGIGFLFGGEIFTPIVEINKTYGVTTESEILGSRILTSTIIFISWVVVVFLGFVGCIKLDEEF